ncbi:MAG: type II toxin-antitoxin system HicA family toxin [Nitrosomonadales bacterium]|nr:type II toxin-antitoxin system HicA family toxin [Nitrosomonadales bacterium]
MPKLPVLSGAEIVKALVALGFVVMRQKGIHIVLRRGSSGCVVPGHKEVKTGTLHGLLRQADVNADEFMRGLGK